MNENSILLFPWWWTWCPGENGTPGQTVSIDYFTVNKKCVDSLQAGTSLMFLLITIPLGIVVFDIFLIAFLPS